MERAAPSGSRSGSRRRRSLAFIYVPIGDHRPVLVQRRDRCRPGRPTGVHARLVREGPRRRGHPPALLDSLQAAIGATAIALVLGSLIAFAVQRYRFFGRETISFLVILPLALPGIVTGIALNTAFRTIGLDFGMLTIIIGHATFCIVVIYNNVIARLRRTSRSFEEASADLGADTFTTFRHVTLPGHPDGAHRRRRCSRSPCRSTRSS